MDWPTIVWIIGAVLVVCIMGGLNCTDTSRDQLSNFLFSLLIAIIWPVLIGAALILGPIIGIYLLGGVVGSYFKKKKVDKND